MRGKQLVKSEQLAEEWENYMFSLDGMLKSLKDNVRYILIGFAVTIVLLFIIKMLWHGSVPKFGKAVTTVVETAGDVATNVPFSRTCQYPLQIIYLQIFLCLKQTL